MVGAKWNTIFPDGFGTIFPRVLFPQTMMNALDIYRTFYNLPGLLGV